MNNIGTQTRSIGIQVQDLQVQELQLQVQDLQTQLQVQVQEVQKINSQVQALKTIECETTTIISLIMVIGSIVTIILNLGLLFSTINNTPIKKENKDQLILSSATSITGLAIGIVHKISDSDKRDGRPYMCLKTPKRLFQLMHITGSILFLIFTILIHVDAKKEHDSCEESLKIQAPCDVPLLIQNTFKMIILGSAETIFCLGQIGISEAVRSDNSDDKTHSTHGFKGKEHSI